MFLSENQNYIVLSLFKTDLKKSVRFYPVSNIS